MIRSINIDTRKCASADTLEHVLTIGDVPVSRVWLNHRAEAPDILAALLSALGNTESYPSVLTAITAEMATA